jgi:pimeloyl-ACP methyl ester carboxylesterase
MILDQEPDLDQPQTELLMSRHITVSGVDLEIEERGEGRPLLFLHAGEGLQPNRPWLDLLASQYRVIAPHHPGFGGSALPDWIGTVDDLAYLYLDLAAHLKLEKAVLAGACFGGWVAAEMAVRNTSRFAGMLLAAPLGIKVGGVLDRDITDMHAIPRDEFIRLSWADPSKGEIDYTSLPDTELAAIARGREALAVFGWKPYMHNPRLKRWLHRIDIPTHILWGEQDGIVSTTYGEAWKAEIPGATMETIPNAGHYPHWEQPETFAARVRGFTERL